MRKIISVAWLNFKEATRDRLFLGAAFFFFFYLAFSIFLGLLSAGHNDKVLREAGLVGIELTAAVLVIFSFTLSFFREKDTRILEVYLSFARRATYLGGKLLGYLLIALFYIILCGLAYAGVLYFYRAFDYAVFAALYVLFLKIIILIGFTAVLCSLLSSPLMALLSSLFLYLTSELAPSTLKLVSAYGRPAQKALVKAAYSFLPNMDKVDIKSQAVYGRLPSGDYFLWITLYVFTYTLCLWLINLYVFQRKEY